VAARIEDVLPTLLYALHLPVPPGLDGVARTEFFTAAWRQAHPLLVAEPAPASGLADAARTAVDSAVYSADEEARVAARLKDLGYLN
jgi:hypothetical protein